MVNKNTPLETLKEEVRIDVLNATKSKKLEFTYSDAVKYQSNGSKRSKVIIQAIDFINSNPLRNNDYYKFLNAYKTTGIKLQDKYFKHDLTLLNSLYERYKDEKVNPFNIDNFKSYVLFMSLKLNGHYKEEDVTIFNVNYVDNREYSPLTKIPTILRSCLPFEVMEFDIKRAFPTFIDMELKADFRHSIYEKISKKNFAMFLNSNSEGKMSIEEVRNSLKLVYGDKTDEVLTDERYNEKGRIFKDLTKYEKQYIEDFVSKNNLKNYARLHDGVFTIVNTECEHLIFDTVEFSIKECIKPKIENNIKSFYLFNEKNEVETSPSMYSDFLDQEKFIRISTPDDKIQLLKNSNNVVDFFNHKTDLVSFLEQEINEVCNDDVRNKIARDNNGVLMQSFTLLKPIPLIYYKDSKERFGLPFNNGFFYFDDKEKFEIKPKPYDEVKGFFTPHPIQKKEFSYTDEVGNFELFIQRISTGSKDFDKSNNEQTKIVNSFNSMIGYLCHNYKPTESPCIVLTDEGANDENRNGRRGKSLVWNAIQQVTKTLQKGGNEFDPNYTFCFADLDKSYNLYVIDEVPCNFNFNSLYTQITGGINAQKKGSKAEMIDREDSPKFIITSNYLFRCDENDASTVARFWEYKIKPYYNVNFSPKDEFNQTFFEDWNETEWNKFYSYFFRCVNYYLLNGLSRIKYNKTDDNFKAQFNSDVKLSEMERIIDILINHRKQTSFTVSDFLSIYNSFENPLRNERIFHTKNTKTLITHFLNQNKHYNFIYGHQRTWWKS